MIRIDISKFKELDAEFRVLGASKKEWAKASHLPFPRLSELYALAEGRKPGRAFTLKKFKSLEQGIVALKKKKGGDCMAKKGTGGGKGGGKGSKPKGK